MADRSFSPLIWVALVVAVFFFLRQNEVGKPAPDFELLGAYGGHYRLDSFRGNPVLLVFWTTSCGICRHELPILDSLTPTAGQNNVQIACVNIGDVDGAREFMRSFHMLNLVDPDGSAARSYGVNGVPKLVLVGADGKILRSASGGQDETNLRDWLH